MVNIYLDEWGERVEEGSSQAVCRIRVSRVFDEHGAPSVRSWLFEVKNGKTTNNYYRLDKFPAEHWRNMGKMFLAAADEIDRGMDK